MSKNGMLLNLKLFSSGGFDRPFALLWFVGMAFVGPIFLVSTGGSESHNLPWYIWVTMLLVLLIVVAIGMLRFMRESHEAEDISISVRAPVG
jgi:hypothetical protein